MHYLKIASARGFLLLAASLVSILNACDSSDGSNADGGSHRDAASPCDGAECSDAGCLGEACADAELGGAPDAAADAAPPEPSCHEDGGCGSEQACSSGDDCETGVCRDEACAPATCDDGVRNGSETDVDCGAGCGECADGATCAEDEDCESHHCSTTCVIEPVAGFELSIVQADVDQPVKAASTATADGAIASIEYDWDEGDGFTDETVHAYETEGDHTVTQRVTDEHGLTTTTTHQLAAGAWA